MKMKMMRSLGAIVALIVMVGCTSNATYDAEAYDRNIAAVQTEADVASPGIAAVHKDDHEMIPELDAIVYFAFDSAALSTDARTILNAQSARLKMLDAKVRVEGYTDERGSREYNMALGQRRANTVANYLIMNGVPRYNIETVSYGEERPANPGHNERAWAENRRAELVIGE